MFDNVKSDDTELAKLVSAIGAHKKKGGLRFPEDLKIKCINYMAKTNIKVPKLSSVIGVTQPTIRRWLNEFVVEPEPKLPDIKIPEQPKPVPDGLITIHYGDKIKLDVPLHLLKPVLQEIGHGAY